MSGFQKDFYLHQKKLPNNIFYAPLAGFTDLPYRKMALPYQVGLQFCEMVKMEPLLRGDPNTLRILDYEPTMHPIGAQLCGSNPKIAKEAAQKIEDLGFDVLDLNCGCPVDRITKDGSGSGLLKQPELLGEILSQLVSAVKIPVTVKIRAGWDENHINAPEITQIAEQAGAAAIGIHGRTREQGYRGSSDREVIQACKQVAKKILVLGNGDLFHAQDVYHMFEQTGCDGVLISRGTMGQPWIVEDVRRWYTGNPLLSISMKERKEALQKHFAYVVSYQNEKKAILEMRKISCLYLKEFPGVKEFRRQLSHIDSLVSAQKIIEEIPIHV